MFREVGKLYLRSFRMIFQYSLFWRLSLAYYLYNFAINSLSTWMRNFQSLGLVVAINWVDFIIGVVLQVGIPLAFIFMVFQIESGEGLHGIFQTARKYFWSFLLQGMMGFFLTLLYSLPFVCLVLYSASLENSPLYLAAFPLWLFVGGFLSLGAVSLGQLILLDGGQGSFTNAVQGIRMLVGNFRFFFPLYLAQVLIGLIFAAWRYGVGSIIAGVDLFSVQAFPLSGFWEILSAATQPPIIQLTDFLFGIVLFPINTIILTLAYLKIKKQPVHIPPIRRKLITDN